jgi:hypothetical protein
MSPYNDTLQEDIFRARDIIRTGTVAGKDVYAALELLKSFVQVLEAVNELVGSGRCCDSKYAHRGVPLVCAQCLVDIIGTEPRS